MNRRRSSCVPLCPIEPGPCCDIGPCIGPEDGWFFPIPPALPPCIWANVVLEGIVSSVKKRSITNGLCFNVVLLVSSTYLFRVHHRQLPNAVAGSCSAVLLKRSL